MELEEEIQTPEVLEKRLMTGSVCWTEWAR